MSGRLDGKVALITGTGGGQGRSAALAFAREGATVVGCDVKVEGALETVELVRAEGGAMTSTQPVDLGDSDQARRWIDDVAAEHARLSALGVVFTQPPTSMGPVTTAVLDDTCGNLIQIQSPAPA